MRYVKIISGAYGHRINSRLSVKDARSEPFCLDDAEAERIVNLGIAEFTDGDAEAAVESVADELSKLTLSELKTYANNHDIEYGGKTTKASIIEAIMANGSASPEIIVSEPLT